MIAVIDQSAHFSYVFCNMSVGPRCAAKKSFSQPRRRFDDLLEVKTEREEPETEREEPNSSPSTPDSAQLEEYFRFRGEWRGVELEGDDAGGVESEVQEEAVVKEEVLDNDDVAEEEEMSQKRRRGDVAEGGGDVAEGGVLDNDDVAVGEEEDGEDVAEEEEGGEDVAEEEEHDEEEEVGKYVAEEASQGGEDVAEEQAETVDARPPWRKSGGPREITMMQQMMMMQAQTTQLKVIEMQSQLQRATSDMQHERLGHRVALSQAVQEHALKSLKLEVEHGLQRQHQDEVHAETNVLHATLVKASTHVQLEKYRNWERQKTQRTNTWNSSGWTSSSSAWETPSQPSSSSWSKPQSQPSSSSWVEATESAWQTPNDTSSSSWVEATESAWETPKPSPPSYPPPPPVPLLRTSWSPADGLKPLPSKPESQPSNSSWPSAETPRRWTQEEKDAQKAWLGMLPRALRAPRAQGKASAANRYADYRPAIGAHPRK